MSTNLYVGNLAYSITQSRLAEMVQEFGQPVSVNVISDRDTGRSKGFGFVEMGTPEQAQAVISGLNGKQVDGRALTVNMARPREQSGGGYSGNGGRQRY